MEWHDIESNPRQSFSQELQEYFSKYEKEFATTGKMDWSCIGHFREYFDKYILRNNLYDIYCKYIFSLFEDAECDDSSVIQTAVKDYMLGRVIDHDPYRPYLRKYVLRRDMHRIITEEIFAHKHCFLRLTFLRDLSAVRLLLRYGLRFAWPSIHNLQEEYLRDEILHLRGIANTYSADVDDLRNMISPLTRMNTIYPTEDSRRRLGFVLVAVHVVNQKMLGSKYYLNCIKSFRLVFKTTAQPLITVPEIARFLDAAYNSKVNKEEKIRKFCNEFAAECPKSCQPLQPRRLKHLARCEVRECLTDTEKLPHGVWALEIPDCLKNYILMQKRKDEFHPRKERPVVPFP